MFCETNFCTLKNLYLLLLGAALYFTSCERDAEFLVPDGNSKLFVYSEITNDEKIKVKVNTTIGVNNTEDEAFFPKQSEALITLIKDGKPLSNPGFRYIASERAFISQGNFRPEIGVEYGLSVELADSDGIKPVVAYTSIPEEEGIKEVEFDNYTEEKIDEGKYFYTDLTIDFSNYDHKYFLLQPKFRNHIKFREHMIVSEFLSGNKGVAYSNVLKGIIVDAESAGNSMEVRLTNNASVPNSFDPATVVMEVKYISEEAFNYYSSFSKQMDAQSAVLSEPVITYSNIENGLGLFTGYATLHQEFELK